MSARISRKDAKRLGLPVPHAKPVKGSDARRACFIALCAAHGIPEPTPEVRFCERRWRFDWAWEAQKVALECDGGAWTQGRHTRGKGFIDDQHKRNRAVVLGWRVIHCTPADIDSGEVFSTLKELLGPVR